MDSREDIIDYRELPASETQLIHRCSAHTQVHYSFPTNRCTVLRIDERACDLYAIPQKPRAYRRLRPDGSETKVLYKTWRGIGSCCPLLAACCLLPATCCLLPAACCLLPAAAAHASCCLLPATCCLLPAVSCQLLDARCLLPACRAGASVGAPIPRGATVQEELLFQACNCWLPGSRAWDPGPLRTFPCTDQGAQSRRLAHGRRYRCTSATVAHELHPVSFSLSCVRGTAHPQHGQPETDLLDTALSLYAAQFPGMYA